MKKLAPVLVALLISVPSVSFAAALTTQQANSLIAVVQSSPGTPASAFTNLITAFSHITTAQADSLISVIQSSPGTVASAFVGFLSAFTRDSSSASTGQSSSQTTVVSSNTNTCNGQVYPSCQDGLAFACTSSGPSCVGANGHPPQPIVQNQSAPSSATGSQQSDEVVNQENMTENNAVAQAEDLISGLKSLESFVSSALSQMTSEQASLESNYTQVTNSLNALGGGTNDYVGRTGSMSIMQTQLKAELADTNSYIPLFRQAVSTLNQAADTVQSYESGIESEPPSYFAAFTTPSEIQATVNEYPVAVSTYEGYYKTWINDLSVTESAPVTLSSPMQCTVYPPTYAGSGGTISCYGAGISASCRYSAIASAGQPISISCSPASVRCTYTQEDFNGAPMGLSCTD